MCSSRLRIPAVRWQSALFLADGPEILDSFAGNNPITGKRVHDTRLVAVLYEQLFDNFLKLRVEHIRPDIPCRQAGTGCRLPATPKFRPRRVKPVSLLTFNTEFIG